MIFCNEYDLGDLISIFSTLLVLAGGVFTFVQWRKAKIIKRSDYINELTEKIRTDSDISKIIYLFEYDYHWYDTSFHGSGELERQVDKTLSYFSYICYLKEQKIIAEKEFKFFKYEIEHILMNYQVLDYLYNIYHYSNKISQPLTFFYLFEYGKQTGKLDKNFMDPNYWKHSAGLYHRYLNFGD